MNNLPPNQWNEADFAELERLIGGAKDFVVPSDQLRPRLVDAARGIDVGRAQLVKIRNLMISVLAVWVLVMGIFWSIRSQRSKFTSPTSQQVEQMSVEYASQRGYSKDWAMVDVFWELRGGDSQNMSPQPEPVVANE